MTVQCTLITGGSKCEITFFPMTVIKKLKLIVQSMTGMI